MGKDGLNKAGNRTGTGQKVFLFLCIQLCIIKSENDEVIMPGNALIGLRADVLFSSPLSLPLDVEGSIGW